MKKPPSKVAHNRPKSHFLFHKNVSLRDFYVLTLHVPNPTFLTKKFLVEIINKMISGLNDYKQGYLNCR